VIAHPKRVGHDGQRGVHRTAGREEAAIHDVEVIHLVGPAVDVQRGSPGILTETNGAVLVRDTRQRDPLAQEQVPGEYALMTLVTMHRALGLRLHELLNLGGESLVPLLVVGPVAEHDLAVPIHRHPVLRVGQVFGGEPEIQRVLAHQVEGPSGSDLRCAGGQSGSVELPHE
jgi:hypothetical protein